MFAPQLSFDDAPVPLHAVTFVVFDLETTGGAAGSDRVTEVGAVKVRGGELLGTFASLVDPGVGVPPLVSALTGITDHMVRGAPPIEAVLPSFLEWTGPDAVLVGHNVRFDLSFVRSACRTLGYGEPANAVVDTCSLARRLLREEVPNCRLATLADRLRLPHRPTHRALDDAWATVDLLHVLLERAGCLGVTFLDDLLELPTAAGHPQAGKLRWVAALPRAPGVYVFRDLGGRPLYVGKAADLRRRVRQYFGGDGRRKVPQLVREAARLDHVVCANELEASVLEARMIRDLAPRFNRHGTRWRQYHYVRLDPTERWPRLAVVRRARDDDGCTYLGPLPSARAARAVVEAVHDASPIRRCTTRIGAQGPAGGWHPAPCGPAQLGVAMCPCSGEADPARYAEVVAEVDALLRGTSAALVERLVARMRRLAASRRFEEAAALRDRTAALARAVERQRRLDALRRAGRITFEVTGQGGAVVEGGRLVAAWPDGHPPLWLQADELAGPPAGGDVGPLAPDHADEAAAVARWLDERRPHVRVVGQTGGWSWPPALLPDLRPAARPGARRAG